MAYLYARPGFMYDSNSQTVALNSSLKCTLQNPSGSGTKIIVEGYSIINQTNLFLTASVIHMPTTNLPTTTVTPLPYMVDTDISNPGNIGIFKYSVALIPMSGGTQIITVPVKPADRNFIEGPPITLLPGVTMGFNLTAPAAATGLTFVVYTREDKL